MEKLIILLILLLNSCVTFDKQSDIGSIYSDRVAIAEKYYDLKIDAPDLITINEESYDCLKEIFPTFGDDWMAWHHVFSDGSCLTFIREKYYYQAEYSIDEEIAHHLYMCTDLDKKQKQMVRGFFLARGKAEEHPKGVALK